MRVVLIEDEVAAREQLSMLLLENKDLGIEIVETIDSVEESIEFFSSSRCTNVDLVFMDIHLSDGYAFSIFKHIEVNIPIIFTTAYDEYALKAFEVNCLDYILKPISHVDIERIFAKVNLIAKYSRSLSVERHLETILVMDGWRTIPLNVDDVALFYKIDSKIRAYNIEGKSFLVNMTLESLEEQLDTTAFIRANRQSIISRSAVSSIESWEGSRAVINMKIKVPERIIISRTKVTQFKRWLFEG